MKALNYSNVFGTNDLLEKIQALPAPVKRRIKALKKLQFTSIEIETKFFEEVYELEYKYHHLYTPLYNKRQLILTGAYEPTDEEAQWPSDDEDEEADLDKEFNTKAKIVEIKESDKVEEKPPVGVPDFWLTIFKNVSPLSDMVQEHDEPILKHLIDIKTILVEKAMVRTFLQLIFVILSNNILFVFIGIYSGISL